MDVEITRKNGETFRLSDYDVQAQDFNVSSIELMPTYGSIEGRSGAVDYGADYGSRTISVPFYLRAYDMHDYPLLRDELFSLVTTKESFYIRELRRPSEVTTCDDGYDDEYVGGKRYLVRLSDVIDFDQQRTYGFGEMVFETTELPFAESFGTTADIDKHGLLYSQELWSYGMGLSYDEETHKYTHNTKTFRIYNAGNVEVHPFEQELKIAIDGINGPYELKNETTGDVFKYTGSNSGKLLLDGPNITLNGLQAFRDTNRRYITLAPGWNTFTQSQNEKVAFDFRYYYK